MYQEVDSTVSISDHDSSLQGGLLEMARLNEVDRMTTALVGLLPEGVEGDHFHRCLDVGSGSGGWALDMAIRFPKLNVVGIDRDAKMVEMAQLLAKTERATGERVRFLEMDATRRLDFPNASFDFVNVRSLNMFGFTRNQWPSIVKECCRVLRPGGCLRLMEMEGGFPTSSAVDFLNQKFGQMLYRLGRTYTESGRGFGITPRLKMFLKEAGFRNIKLHGYPLDCSANTPWFQEAFESFILLYHKTLPSLIATGVGTAEEFEQAFSQAIKDMKSQDYGCICFYLSACGSV